MALEALAAPLKRVELFQALSTSQIGEIARAAERIIFRPGDVIVHKDAEGDAAYVIVTGEASRIAGPGAGPEAEPIGPASLIGEMAMIVDTDHSATIQAVTQVRALKITRKAMHQIMAADPEMAEHFVDVIVGRLQRVAAQLRAVDAGLGSMDVAAGHIVPAATGACGPEASLAH